MDGLNTNSNFFNIKVVCTYLWHFKGVDFFVPSVPQMKSYRKRFTNIKITLLTVNQKNETEIMGT